MNQLRQLISQMSEEELRKLKKDLEEGNLYKLINKKLEEYEEVRNKEKICPVCGDKVESNAYVLEFGKSYLRRKAYFDGQDCLNYFIQTKMKKKV